MRIDKHILFDLIRSRCSDPDILWLTETIVFHDPTQDYIAKSGKKMMENVPRQKSLFGSGKFKGLPIGNLTSQFFANIYLNGLDQFVKHELKCTFYARYVDDFVLIDRDEKKLRAWEKRITDYLAEKLELELNPVRRRFRNVSEGIDFLGYVIRPDYVLCRNRVVNNLKTRLIEFERKLIVDRSGFREIKYDYELLEDMFCCLNSYFAHFKHANTYSLVNSIFQNNRFLNHYFSYDNNRLKRRYASPVSFRRLSHQYRHFERKFKSHVIFFQVGCFYEFYGRQASIAVHALGLKRIRKKYGYQKRCGFGVNALDRYIKPALATGLPAVIVNQTGYVQGNVLERRVEKIWSLCPYSGLPDR